MKKQKFYITTSIPYVNLPGHLGHALEFIQADVLARYHRLLDEDVFFLTGTDENGLKNFQAAEKTDKTPQKFVDEVSAKFKKLTRVLNMSNDDFIRTTDKKRHWPTVQKVWLKLRENNDIYKKKYKGLYCVGCEAFIKEKDLIDGKCPIHKKELQILEEENYFFRLSKYQKRIEEIIKKDKIKIIPEARKNEILSFIKQGVEDISCSRSKENLKWGVPVPDDGTQLIYIWLEALLNYISALDYAKNGAKFKKFWPANVHCVGKDIFRFHSLLWPAVLLSLKLPLPKTIFVHGFITVAGQKMSKSLGNVIDPFELVKKYGTDAVRYFLLREIPATEDGDFTYEKFERRYNADLANGLGNLVSRVSKLNENLKVKNKKSELRIKNLEGLFNEFKFKEILDEIWQQVAWANKYIEEKKLWELVKTDPKEGKKVLAELLSLISEIAEVISPFMPETSEKIFAQLEAPKSEPLFPRIS